MYDRRQQEMEEEYFAHQDYMKEAYGDGVDTCYDNELDMERDMWFQFWRFMFLVAAHTPDTTICWMALKEYAQCYTPVAYPEMDELPF